MPRRLTQIGETSRGLGALIAEKFAIEGCNIAVNYNASKERAEGVVEKLTKEYKIKSFVIHGVRSCDRKQTRLIPNNVLRTWAS